MPARPKKHRDMGVNTTIGAHFLNVKSTQPLFVKKQVEIILASGTGEKLNQNKRGVQSKNLKKEFMLPSPFKFP